MAVLLTLLAGIAVVMVAAQRLQQSSCRVQPARTTNARIQSASKLIPHALTMLVMVAHASEITRVVSHISALHAGAALLLFAVWAFSQTGSETI